MNPDREHSEQQMKQSRWGFRGMTVRNWLELLVVPLALLAIGFLFSVQQDARQQRIENQRAEAERELAVQRAQDEALQAYLDQMDTLLLEKDLRNAHQDSEVRTLARARTLTVLERLDPSRKTAVMQFLMEARLAFRGMGQLDPVIDLYGANLGEIDLGGLVANLSGATLSEADLSGADLSGAILTGTVLYKTDLSGAILRSAAGDSALLYKADLSGADLHKAILIEADLSGADLSGADLFKANLNNGQGITNEELDQQAASLEGATMPNGQKYEDWLKSKDRGEDGENNDP